MFLCELGRPMIWNNLFLSSHVKENRLLLVDAAKHTYSCLNHKVYLDFNWLSNCCNYCNHVAKALRVNS